MAELTVAEYTLTRLSQLGIDRIFGVPGDYAFPINDAAEVVSGLSWVGCANELNAAYAADGYARIRGAAILSTTFGVGELSALNGVMGSKAQRLPVFHLVGMPSERIQKLGLITHHTLGDGVYDQFRRLSAAACCVEAVLSPDNCVQELERVIREALRQSRPAYLLISEMEAILPVRGQLPQAQPLQSIERQTSVPQELEAAVSAILLRLERAQRPVLMVTDLVRRYGLRRLAEAFIRKANLPTVVAPYDKGCVDESLPPLIGLYAGQESSSALVRATVEEADLVLDLGGVVAADLNTGGWSFPPDATRRVTVHDDWVRVGDRVFLHTALEDVLRALVERVSSRVESHSSWLEIPPQGSGEGKTADGGNEEEEREHGGSQGDGLTSAQLYPQLFRHFRPGDTLLMETGSCLLHLLSRALPAGVDAELQGLWGSIGWATPAGLGVAMAKTAGRTWVVTGDGAHQLTLNELAVMGRYDVKPVMVILNNGLYGIEDVLSERGHGYDDLAAVQYHLLPMALGCKGWLTARAATVKELEAVLAQIDEADCAVYIEVLIANQESQPLPKRTLDQFYKLQTPPIP
jgi:indolepyruvate decarboxylase